MNIQTHDDLPLVTIITSSYNQANYIGETIDSVLTQDYPCIEYLIFDDSSTDGTPEKLAAYGNRICWEKLAEKTPQTPTINKGWRMTKGEIITWLNSDDAFYPGTITKIVEYFKKHPETGIVFGDSMWMEEDGTDVRIEKPPSDFNFRDFVLDANNVIAQPSAFIRRDVIEKIGYLNEEYDYVMDWEFWLRAGIHFKIEYIPELLSKHRIHADAKTLAQATRFASELQRMYDEFYLRSDLTRELREIENEAKMNMYFTSGNFYLQGNEPGNASKMADKAFKQNPRSFFKVKNIHKYLYCKFAGTALYQKAREYKLKKSLE